MRDDTHTQHFNGNTRGLLAVANVLKRTFTTGILPTASAV